MLPVGMAGAMRFVEPPHLLLEALDPLLLLGEAAAKGRGIALKDHMAKARDGHHGARATGDIGFASLRGGTVAGEHSVILAGQGERITLSHSAESRDNWANGAIKAALWARGRKPGYFTMTDVLGLAD